MPAAASPFSGRGSGSEGFLGPVRRTSFIQVLHEMDGRQALVGAIWLHAALAFGFMIPAFILARIQAGGFNVVFTATLLPFYTAALLPVLPDKQPSPLVFGAVLGATSVMAFISLMTAVFWGQFSACQEQYSGYVDTYTCYSPGAMTAVAAFASLLFVLETVLGIFLVAWVPVLCPDYNASSAGGPASTFAYASIHQGEGMGQPEEEEEEGRIVILDRAAVLAAAAASSSSSSPQPPAAPGLYQAAEVPATTQPRASPTRPPATTTSSRGGKGKKPKKGTGSGGGGGKR